MSLRHFNLHILNIRLITKLIFKINSKFQNRLQNKYLILEIYAIWRRFNLDVTKFIYYMRFSKNPQFPQWA